MTASKRISLQKIGNMAESALMNLRFCELDISLSETWLVPYVERLQTEIQRAGLHYLKPKAYFGDEWFCPEGSTLISVPFYLAHPRLAALEKKHVGKAEGDTPTQVMKLLRHEAGHCFNHAYQLYKTREWRHLFGDYRQPYNVENYQYDAHSRSFVQHLSGYYAQSHPDEDFAETFAVWLAPRSNWRVKYRDWPIALRKLCYIEKMAAQLRDKPFTRPARPMSHVKGLRSTLGRYYRRRNSAKFA